MDKVKLAQFETELKALLEQFNYQFAVVPFFIDKLGNRHVITIGGDISAELQIKEIEVAPIVPADTEASLLEDKENDNGTE